MRALPGFVTHTSDVAAHGARLPDEADLRRAASLLDAGQRVAILAGRGALGAGDLVERAADTLAAPIVKALLGKAVVPDDSPFTTGPVGLLGSRPSQEALARCDTLLMIGTSFPYLEYYPPPGQARGVQIDVDPTRIGQRYPVEIGLVGDSARTLEALLPLLARKADRSFLEAAQSGMADWRALLQERESRPDRPMKPEALAHALGERLRHDAIVACDSGTVATWWARHIPARRGQLHSISGNLATMANAVPYAIAAQIAYPGRQVVAFVGDGGFSMLMAEFATAVKYRLPIKVVVVRNDSLGMIKWEQMAFLGHPEYGCDLQPIDFAMFARACGGAGFYTEDPVDCGSVLDQALDSPAPAIVEARVDPLEPPYPPKITMGQAGRFASALARSGGDRARLAWTVLSDRVRHLV